MSLPPYDALPGEAAASLPGALSAGVAAVVDEAVPFALPLRRRFRGTELREGVALRIGGRWGEWAPFPEYDDAVATRWLRGALEAARGEWPAPVRDSVEVNAIVPALDPEAAAALVVEAVSEDGCTVVKVKVAERGGSFDDDVARVAAVRRALDACGATEGRIRVDANGAWTVAEAFVRLEVLDAVAGGLDYAEQPCATLTELAALRAAGAGGVRIAVDEGVRLAPFDDAGDDAGAGEWDDAWDEEWVAQVRAAADVLVLKAVPLGGVRRSLALAAQVGLPVTVSGALDSTVGLGASLALAGALPDPPGACGLGTGRLLAADLTATTALPRDGRLTVAAAIPDPAALRAARARLDDARVAWWLDRLARCLALLPAGPPAPR